MRRLLIAPIAAAFLAFGSTLHAADVTEEKFAATVKEALGKYKGTMVLQVGDAAPLRYNAEMAAEPASPCSTFKIPNTLIALETGVLEGPETELKWDGTKRWLEAWNQDLTLKEAFKHSAVWYYQEVARRIGAERMQAHLDKFGYGNRDISGGIDQFWLGSSIKISADDQVKFLRKLQAGELPISAETLKKAREVMQQDSRGGRVLFGKTGTDGDSKTNDWHLGWFVGWVESTIPGEEPVIFATRITGGEKAWGPQARILSEEILTKLGHWPAE